MLRGVLAYGQQQAQSPATPLDNLVIHERRLVRQTEFRDRQADLQWWAMQPTASRSESPANTSARCSPPRCPVASRPTRATLSPTTSNQENTPRGGSTTLPPTPANSPAIYQETSSSCSAVPLVRDPCYAPLIESPSDNTLTFLLEMKQGDNWTKLFLTTYTKKAIEAQK